MTISCEKSELKSSSYATVYRPPSGSVQSLIGELAGVVEVGLKWQYLPAACDFVSHADVLLQSRVESLRQSVVVG